MATPYFDYKSQNVKGLIQESHDMASGLALLTLPFLMLANEKVVNVVAVPFMALTTPFIFAEQTTDYISRARQEWKRSKIGPAEQSIRETFGNIAVKGYKHWDGGIEMKLTESCVYNIYDNKPEKNFAEADIHRMDIHHDREQCAKDLLGNVAANICGKTRGFGAFVHGVEKRYLVVRKAGDLQSTFYTAAQVDSLDKVPENAIAATHSYYSEPIGHGRRENITHYAITKVDEATARRLRGLGL
jgi:hypothetical protein